VSTSEEQVISPNEQLIIDEWKTFPMREPLIAKVVVDICVGGGETLERAATILKNLTGQTPAQSKAHQTIRDFGIRKKEPIAVLQEELKETVGNIIDWQMTQHGGSLRMTIMDLALIQGRIFEASESQFRKPFDTFSFSCKNQISTVHQSKMAWPNSKIPDFVLADYGL
jgi:hypothetical protein